MKSLNRTLSLVLVLVMVFGLFGVASAATFTDAAKVQYTEAVDVMTGIGAINGYTDGTFNPTGTITREEAAKMVTYAVLGPTIAKSLTVTSTGFKDVAAGRWSAPFISYCVSKGIINGMGDGTFAPEGNVTGYQLAKMLLCAVGYGKQGEFTGASWELNVAVDANKRGIFTSSQATSFSSAATREEAALYVFNTLTNAKAGQVTYSKATESYSAAGNTIGTDVYTLTSAPTTVNGVAGHIWKNTALNKEVSGFIPDTTEVVIGKNTAGLNIKTQLATKSAVTPYYIAAIDETTMGTTLKVYYNGKQVDYSNTANYWYDTTAHTVKNTADADAVIKGTVVTFVDTNNDKTTAEKIYVVNKTVDVLAAAPVTYTLADGNTYIFVDGTIADLGKSEAAAKADPTGAVLAKYATGYTGLVKGDVVLSVAMDSGVTSYEKAKAVTGAMSAYQNTANGYSYTIAGTAYGISKLANATSDATVQGLMGKTGNFFVDNDGGYIVYAAASTDTTAYTYGTVIAYSNTAGSLTTAEVCKMQLVLADGTKKVFDVKLAIGTNPATSAYAEGDLVKYFVNETGVITQLSMVIDQSVVVADSENLNLYSFSQGSAAVSLHTNNADTVNLATKYLTSTTKFVFYDKAADFSSVTGTESGKTYVGYANCPSVTGKVAYYVLNALDSSKVDMVYFCSTADPSVITSEKTAFILNTNPSVGAATINGTPVVVYSWTAFEGGKAITLNYVYDSATVAAMTTAIGTPGLYTYTLTNGYMTSTGTAAVAEAGVYLTACGSVTSVQDSYIVTAADGVVYTNASTKYYQVTSTGIVEGTLAASNASSTTTVTYVVKSATADVYGHNNAVAVYYTIA